MVPEVIRDQVLVILYAITVLVKLLVASASFLNALFGAFF